ncbi:MAG: S26 family signal peptidase [Clostridia bacterium]|nr:S26 family signal peptidase [Clostridia bacterium]
MNTVQTSIRAYLDEHEYLAYRISGVSMLPMLRQEKDLVTLRRYDGKGLKKYDVAMYDRGGPRRYVLHRVVEVGDGSYTFLGDNCITKERNISESAIVAVLDSFTREGKQISVNDPKYRIYVRVHCALFPVRRLYKKVRARAARVPALRKVWNLIHGRR